MAGGAELGGCFGHASQAQEELQELQSQLVAPYPRPSGEEHAVAQTGGLGF